MAPVRLLIRRARPEDARALRDVRAASIRGLCAAAYGTSQIRAWAGNRRVRPYRRVIEEGKEDVFVALRGRIVAGFASLEGDKVRTAYVHPRFAGRGVGGSLLGTLERLARRRGRRRLVLDSTLNAVGFYERFGFRRGQRGSHNVDGARITCVRMIKRLK